MKKLSNPKTKEYIAAAIIIAAVMAIVLVKWLAAPAGERVFDKETVSYDRATVISVDKEVLEESKDVPGRRVGEQYITVRFTGGDRKGESVEIVNYLTAEHSVEVRRGTRIIVKCDCPEGVEPMYNVYQYDRSVGIYIAGALFVLLLFVVGRSKGLRSALALAVSIAVIALGVIPDIYNGRSPVLAAMLACAAITAVTLILLNGFSKKTFAAILSAVIGLSASIIAYYGISALLTVSGYALEETGDLIMVSRKTGLRIADVLFSGIMLASLGAVMDTAMSISSALFEINESGSAETNLFRAGMNIGRDMIGTMCQTLILAFAGSSMASLLVAVSYSTKFHQFLSSDYLAVEIFQSLTGSFAVIVTVPITAFLCARFAGRRGKTK
ncbi:MAG: YibE/F family protein [Clostridia bacterium]|nr:YibE/F family protein [Clostridia bacterium]